MKFVSILLVGSLVSLIGVLHPPAVTAHGLEPESPSSVGLLAGAPPPDVGPKSDADLHIIVDRHRPGDVLHTGTVDEDGRCMFPSFQVLSEAPHGEGKNWALFAFNDDCTLTLDAAWQGSLEEGTRFDGNPLEPLLHVLQENSSPPIPEVPAPHTVYVPTLQDVEAVVDGNGARSSWQCTKHEQHIWTYGHGGEERDQLTHKFGFLHFCYNGKFVSLVSHSGSCRGSNPFWGTSWWSWIVTACETTDFFKNDESVWREGRGTYSCEDASTPPCSLGAGYHHRLYDYEFGYKSGYAFCGFWHEGTVVKGPLREILQGCG